MDRLSYNYQEPWDGIAEQADQRTDPSVYERAIDATVLAAVERGYPPAAWLGFGADHRGGSSVVRPQATPLTGASRSGIEREFGEGRFVGRRLGLRFGLGGLAVGAIIQ